LIFVKQSKCCLFFGYLWMVVLWWSSFLNFLTTRFQFSCTLRNSYHVVLNQNTIYYRFISIFTLDFTFYSQIEIHLYKWKGKGKKRKGNDLTSSIFSCKELQVVPVSQPNTLFALSILYFFELMFACNTRISQCAKVFF
jgi:hypothetical protein